MTLNDVQSLQFKGLIFLHFYSRLCTSVIIIHNPAVHVINFVTTYFRTNTGFNLGLASSSESVYSSYSEDWKTNYHGFSTKMKLSMISF